MSILMIRDGNGNIIEIPAIKGSNGKSAYEIAVANGFEGSEKEWLMDLKSPRLIPEFANSIEECTDTSKLYVLPDGFIYAYMMYESSVAGGEPLFTNLADPTSDDWLTDYRFSSSSGSNSACAGAVVSNAIAAKKGDVIRIKGLQNGTTSATSNAYFGMTAYNDVAGTTLALSKPFCFAKTVSQHQYGIQDIVTMEDGVTTHTLFQAVKNDGSAYEMTGCANAVSIRVSGEPVTTVDDIIVTINEEIAYSEGSTETGYAWQSTGHAFVPADYENEISELKKTTNRHTSQIAALEKSVESGTTDVSEEAALARIKNWKYPIHEDAPVFLLETDKPAISSNEQTTAAIYAKYDTLMASNSHYITKTNCGMASDGITPIYVYEFKEPEPHHPSGDWSETKPTILVVSGVHPTEQSGIWSMYYAMEEITNNIKLHDLRRNVHFVIMPMINPTAFSDSVYAVRNPDGIQVHYNFEVDFKYPTDSGYVVHGERNHGGETPLSIPETRYFDALMDKYKDTLACVLSCHNNDLDTQWGSSFVWFSCATHFMCNLGYRFIDKMSVAWREKHGDAFDTGIRWANDYVLNATNSDGSKKYTLATTQPEWDYRVGKASLSASGGTEYKQAMKYGVHGVNVEVSDRCMILDRDVNKTRTTNVTTMGTETYVNFFRTFMAVYDPKDKKDYAPNLPWSE